MDPDCGLCGNIVISPPVRTSDHPSNKQAILCAKLHKQDNGRILRSIPEEDITILLHYYRGRIVGTRI